ncbi:putative ribonuclease H-like domain-containing protein [Tanacetum coccineum]
MDNTIAPVPIRTPEFPKDHLKGQILGDPKSAVQTRGKIQKASSAQQALFKLQKVWVLVDLPYGKKHKGLEKEGIYYDEVFAPVARIEAIRLFLAFTSYMGFTVYQMDVKSAFLYGTIEEEVYVHQPLGLQVKQLPKGIFISQDKYVADILKKFDFLSIRTATTPIESNKPLDSPFELEAYSDSDYGGASLDRKSTTGGCQFLGRRLISWQCKKQTIMAQQKDQKGIQDSYVVGSSGKDKGPTQMHKKNLLKMLLQIRMSKIKRMLLIRKNNIRCEIMKKICKMSLRCWISMDLRMDRSWAANSSYSWYALTHNPTIYDSLVKQFWQTATVRTLANGTQQLIASIDSTEYTITEASVRSKLQLADATGIHNLSDAKIYAGLATLSHKSGGWDQFGSTIATALICLSAIGCSYGSRSYEAPLPEGNTSGSAEDSMQLKELMDIVPKLVTRIETLETKLQQTKTTYGKAVLTLVKRVKILEKALKRKTQKVVISESEGEEPEDQGRIIQDIDDDPLVSLVRESMKMKEKSTDFVTPTKASGEAQEEDISPTILEAAKTLSKVASQGVSKVKSTDKGKRYRRRARSVAKNINTGLDAEEEINTGRVEINTGIEDVNTGSTKVDSGTASKRGQREGKAQMVEEDIQATHKTKEQIRQEEAGLEEAIKLQAQMDEEVAKQIHLDEMDAIRAKLEANAELTKDVLGKDLPEQDFAKRMVDMLSQLKKLSFEEVKEEFDKVVQQIDTFDPMDFEATKEKLKRYGEELQTKTSKKQKIDDKDVLTIGEKVAEVKEEEPIKRTGKRKKQKARRCISIDKNAQGDSKTDNEESVEAMNPTPLATKSNSVVNWKIF